MKLVLKNWMTILVRISMVIGVILYLVANAALFICLPTGCTYGRNIPIWQGEIITLLFLILLNSFAGAILSSLDGKELKN